MIILAFPGLGKTTLSKLKGGFIDLDFDFFRSSAKGLGLTDQGLIHLYAQVAKRYEKAGYIVLLNELGVLDDASIKVSRIYYPDGKETEIRCAAKLKVDMNTLWGYQFDWIAASVEHNIPAIPVSGTLANYLRPNRR